MSDVKRYAFQIHRRPYGLEEVRSGNLVMHSDYAKLKAEAQALREEVAALRARVVVMAPERKAVPEYASQPMMHCGATGWNACLDELARLNGKAVSEGLLRDIYLAGWQASGEGWNEEYPGDAHNRQEWKDSRDAAIKALLGEGKEHE